MKNAIFKCELTDRAICSYEFHKYLNPNGLPIHNGRSGSKVYYDHIIYETKTSVVVKPLKSDS